MPACVRIVIDEVKLVRYFAQRFARRIETIPSAVMEALVRFACLGNIREPKNVIGRAVFLSSPPRRFRCLSATCSLRPLGISRREIAGARWRRARPLAPRSPAGAPPLTLPLRATGRPASSNPQVLVSLYLTT